MPILETQRLRLIPATIASLQAEIEQPNRLGEVLGVHVPENWPPDLYDRDAIDFTLRHVTENPALTDWLLYYFVQKATTDAPAIAVGSGGFTGLPTEEGVVKVGYSILEQYRRRGYASEATGAFVDHAFAQPDIEYVIADTYPELAPSIGVLEKLGFVYAGPGDEERVIRYELPRATWKQTCRV
jgi:ribosomal-protein-alanine N-acetyltransferase